MEPILFAKVGLNAEYQYRIIVIYDTVLGKLQKKKVISTLSPHQSRRNKTHPSTPPLYIIFIIIYRPPDRIDRYP